MPWLTQWAMDLQSCTGAAVISEIKLRIHTALGMTIYLMECLWSQAWTNITRWKPKTNNRLQLDLIRWKGLSHLSRSVTSTGRCDTVRRCCEGNTAMKPLLTRSPLRQMSWRGYRLAGTLMQWLSSVYNNQWLDTWDGTLPDTVLSSEIKLRGTYCTRWNI